MTTIQRSTKLYLLELDYFVDEDKDGTVTDTSLQSAKDLVGRHWEMPALYQPSTCSVVIKVQPLS